MRYLFQILGLSAVLCAPGTPAAGTEAPGDELILPVQKMSVDLETGIVSRKGEHGLCLENGFPGRSAQTCGSTQPG